MTEETVSETTPEPQLKAIVIDWFTSLLSKVLLYPRTSFAIALALCSFIVYQALTWYSISPNNSVEDWNGSDEQVIEQIMQSVHKAESRQHVEILDAGAKDAGASLKSKDQSGQDPENPEPGKVEGFFEMRGRNPK